MDDQGDGLEDCDLDDPDEESPEPAICMERFAEELERMMIAGHSSTTLERWALLGYRVTRDELEQVKTVIRRSWALESQATGLVNARRNALRTRYFEIYERSMSESKYLPAIKALDSVAKLDGLTSDVNLTQINLGGEDNSHGQTQITNGTRERIAQLAETMRLRSEKRSELLEKTQVKVLDVSKKSAGR